MAVERLCREVAAMDGCGINDGRSNRGGRGFIAAYLRWSRALMCTVQHTPAARHASQDANASQLLLWRRESKLAP